METVELALRAGGGLAAVLGCVWLAARVARRRLGVLEPGALRLRLLQRLPVGRRSAVVVLDAGDELLVLGVSDTSVSLLATREADVGGGADQRTAAGQAERTARAVRDENAARGENPERGENAERTERAEPGQPTGRTTGPGPVPRPRALAGSALDPQTWRQALDAARDRTVRR